MAVALPVVVGCRESMAERARRRSLCGESTTTFVFVGSWMVVIWPCLMPIDSWTTLTTGARQFVVHDAAVSRRWRLGSYSRSLTPTTTLRAAASLMGAA